MLAYGETHRPLLADRARDLHEDLRIAPAEAGRDESQCTVSLRQRPQIQAVLPAEGDRKSQHAAAPGLEEIDLTESPSAVHTDVEHAKRAEETLRNAEKDVRTILETIPAIVWTAQPDGALDFISQSWTERMGGERRGWSWTEVVHPDDIERIVYDWRGALDSGRPLDHELRLRERDGSYRWYLVRAVPRRDDAGSILRWYGTITDIDDRKRAEDELRALKDQLQKENVALRDEVTQTSMFEEIVGSSDPLRRVLVARRPMRPSACAFSPSRGCTSGRSSREEASISCSPRRRRTLRRR